MKDKDKEKYREKAKWILPSCLLSVIAIGMRVASGELPIKVSCILVIIAIVIAIYGMIVAIKSRD